MVGIMERMGILPMGDRRRSICIRQRLSAQAKKILAEREITLSRVKR
jgi:hypothetical protein